MYFLVKCCPFYQGRLIVVLRNVVWNSGNPKFDSQDVNSAPLFGCGELGGVDREKRPLAHNTKCIFWSNGGHSTKAGWLLEKINPFFETEANRQFDSQEVDAAPSFRLRQARLSKYGEGSARPQHQMYFLIKCRPFYQGRLIVGDNKMFLKRKQIVNSIANESRTLLLAVAANSAGSIRRRDGSLKTPNVFFGRRAAILPRQVDCWRK
jgi:hypothetical protein